MADIFENACSKISKIEKELYFTFNENTFVQSCRYGIDKHSFVEEPLISNASANNDKNTNISNNSSSYTTKNKNNKNDNKTILYYSNLVDIFVRLVNPLWTKEDALDDLCKNLDKYKYLLKTITSKYKQLHNNITDYVRSNSKHGDMSYANRDYMMFWCKLLNASIYIIVDNMYYEYNCENSANFLVIRVSTKPIKYELVDTNDKDFKTFNAKFEYKKWIDVNKLSSKKMSELMDICNEHNIQLQPKMKKINIIERIKEMI